MGTEKVFKWEIKLTEELEKRTDEELLDDYRAMVSYVYESEHQTTVSYRDLRELSLIEEIILKRMK